MREILFRGKAKAIAGCPYNNGKSDGEWVFGYIFPDLGAMKIRQFEPDRPECNDYEVDPETVGQYTGLTDKNGKRIFEGDILRGFEYPFCSNINGEFNYFAEVVWFDDSSAFGIYTFKNPKSNVRGISEGNTDYLEYFNVDKWEIIGNIHDNPELLEGGEGNG